MLLTLILSAVAGFATPYVEPFVAKTAKPILPKEFPMAEGEFRTLTLVLLLLAVSILTIGTVKTAIPVILGGGLGYFGMRLVEVAKKVIADQKANNSEDA